MQSDHKLLSEVQQTQHFAAFALNPFKFSTDVSKNQKRGKIQFLSNFKLEKSNFLMRNQSYMKGMTEEFSLITQLHMRNAFHDSDTTLLYHLTL